MCSCPGLCCVFPFMEPFVMPLLPTSRACHKNNTLLLQWHSWLWLRLWLRGFILLKPLPSFCLFSAFCSSVPRWRQYRGLVTLRPQYLSVHRRHNRFINGVVCFHCKPFRHIIFYLVSFVEDASNCVWTRNPRYVLSSTSTSSILHIDYIFAIRTLRLILICPIPTQDAFMGCINMLFQNLLDFRAYWFVVVSEFVSLHLNSMHQLRLNAYQHCKYRFLSLLKNKFVEAFTGVVKQHLALWLIRKVRLTPLSWWFGIQPSICRRANSFHLRHPVLERRQMACFCSTPQTVF